MRLDLFGPVGADNVDAYRTISLQTPAAAGRRPTGAARRAGAGGPRAAPLLPPRRAARTTRSWRCATSTWSSSRASSSRWSARPGRASRRCSGCSPGWTTRAAAACWVAGERDVAPPPGGAGPAARPPDRGADAGQRTAGPPGRARATCVLAGSFRQPAADRGTGAELLDAARPGRTAGTPARRRCRAARRRGRTSPRPWSATRCCCWPTSRRPRSAGPRRPRCCAC